MERQFNVSGCDPAVRKRCSFLQLTTTYCAMWAGTRAQVRADSGIASGPGVDAQPSQQPTA